MELRMQREGSEPSALGRVLSDEGDKDTVRVIKTQYWDTAAPQIPLCGPALCQWRQREKEVILHKPSQE